MATAEVSSFIANNPELRYCLEDIKQNGWNFPPARTYPIPAWVFETKQDPLPAFMYAPNGELWNDINYDPYPGDYWPGEHYVTSLQSPDNPAAYGGYGGGGGGGGGGFGGRGGMRGGGPPRGGRGGGGRGICNSFRDRGSCRFGADCNFSHDLEGIEGGMREFSLGERPGGPRPERGGRGGGAEGRGGAFPRGGGEQRGGAAPRGGAERGGMRGGGAERGGRGGFAERGGRGGARGGGAGRGGGDLCRFYNTPQGCRFGDSCKSRHA